MCFRKSRYHPNEQNNQQTQFCVSLCISKTHLHRKVLKLGGIFLFLKAINAIARHLCHQQSHKSLQKAPSISVSLFEHSQQNHRKLLVRPVFNSPLQVALPHHDRNDPNTSQASKEETFIFQHVFRTPCWSDLGSCTETLSWPDKGKQKVCIQGVYPLCCWCYLSHK